MNPRCRPSPGLRRQLVPHAARVHSGGSPSSNPGRVKLGAPRPPVTEQSAQADFVTFQRRIHSLGRPRAARRHASLTRPAVRAGGLRVVVAANSFAWTDPRRAPALLPRRDRQSAQADFVWSLRRIHSLGWDFAALGNTPPWPANRPALIQPEGCAGAAKGFRSRGGGSGAHHSLAGPRGSGRARGPSTRRAQSGDAVEVG
jgi:hypothetical protein